MLLGHSGAKPRTEEIRQTTRDRSDVIDATAPGPSPRQMPHCAVLFDRSASLDTFKVGAGRKVTTPIDVKMMGHAIALILLRTLLLTYAVPPILHKNYRGAAASFYPEIKSSARRSRAWPFAGRERRSDQSGSPYSRSRHSRAFSG